MEPLSSIIYAANHVLIEEGNSDLISNYFAADYVAHLTDQDLAGGHKLIRGIQKGSVQCFRILETEFLRASTPQPPHRDLVQPDAALKSRSCAFS